MINRINLILKAKNISARQFAEEIGIQPSGMSHILGGRNNPSLDFVTKVIRRYPEIDANWLLLGKGEMYASQQVDLPMQPSVPPISTDSDDESSTMVQSAPPYEPTLFDSEVKVAMPTQTEAPMQQQVPTYGAEPQQADTVQEPSLQYRPTYVAVPPAEVATKEEKESPKLTRILFIYSDNTFAEYTPHTT